MTMDQARARLAKVIERDGVAPTATRLRCSTAQVHFIVAGKRSPGLRIALAIEELYEIPAKAWVDEPLTRKVS